MFKFIKKIFSSKVSPMNKIIIHEKNILKNLEYLKSLQKNTEIFPVLKSNAYGHWLKQMCKILNKTDVKILVVDSFPEYQIVRDYTNKDILLLWETISHNYKKFDLKRVHFCVYNIETIRYISKLKKKIKIHLFLNTGMNREWVNEDELLNILEYLKKYPKVKIEWVLSHFHSADIAGKEETINEQIKLFKKMYHIIIDYGYTPQRKHIWNSAGHIKMQDAFFNASRIWLSLYGYNPLSSDDEYFKIGEKLLPALSIQSRVVSLHSLFLDEGVSYGLIRKSDQENNTIATIPFGYAEWLPRILSNKIKFYHQKRELKQIGNICMNLTSLQGDKDIAIWDTIKIIDTKEENNIVNRANISGMLVYEILVKLDKGIRREII